MSINCTNEIYSSRVLNAPLEIVYNAFANPLHLKEWWGPEGFTNTIHEFDLQPGGKWLLTMHGPEKGNYENFSIFKIKKQSCGNKSKFEAYQKSLHFTKIGLD